MKRRPVVDWSVAGQYVRPLSVNVHRSYPTVSTEDIAQEMWLWFCNNPEKAHDYLNDEDPRRGARMLSASLLNRGRAFAQREKAALAGYEVQDNHWYSQNEIEYLLPQVWDRESWANPPAPPKPEVGGPPVTRTDPALKGDHLASLADVADALRRVDRRTFTVLRLIHHHHQTQAQVARTLELAESTVSEIVSRAPGKLQRLLGGSRPYDEPDEEPVGHRLVLTNAASQAAVSNGYDGD